MLLANKIMQVGFFPSPPTPLFLFESSYKVGGHWSGTGWLEGTSGFTIMAATSQKRRILTYFGLWLLWRGNECHHHQFQWLPLRPVCIRRDLGCSWFLLWCQFFPASFLFLSPSSSPEAVCCLSASYIFCSTGTRMQLKAVLWAVQVGHVAW